MRRESPRGYALLAVLAMVLAGAGRPVPAADTWKPAAAPLMTRWSADVRPDRVRPEYPRPQLQRKEWLNLNGLWQFAFDDRNEGRGAGWSSGKELPERILVPFTFEAALSGIGKGKEVHERAWYRRTFDLPSGWNGRRVRLNFGACDWESTVWVNGKEVGTHRGGYTPFSYDITDELKPGGPQELVVAIYDPADPRKGAYQPKGKQLGSEGIWYTRTTGIWQTVWLEPLAATLDYRKIEPIVNVATREAAVVVDFRADHKDVTDLEVSLSLHGKRVAKEAETDTPAFGRARGDERSVRVLVEPVELWSPEHPALYDLTLRAKKGRKVVDEVHSYCAFREYAVKDGRLQLNGKPYFLRGVLDQGYWPDGILTPPTDEAIRSDVEMTKRLGFNMARKHVKVEDPRWYYWCDRLGLAVWQDMPSSHNLAGEEAKANFKQEWTAEIADLRSHPCILHWIPFNENWGNPGAFQDEIVRLTKTIDPSRPVTDASGWTQRGLTDVIDAHDYGNNLRAQGVERPLKPKVVGEYGGVALPVPGHTWTSGWGYQLAKDPRGLLRRVRYLTTQLHEAANLSGFVYTQLTDVEQELNGLMTYDRRPKAEPAEFAAIFEGRSRSELGAGWLRDWLVLGPLPAGVELRSAQNSAENRAIIRRMLETPLLKSEAQPAAQAGGTEEVGGKRYAWQAAHVEDTVDFQQLFGGGETRNAVAFAVAEFQSPREVRNATLLFGSDDGAQVWLNGQAVWTVDRIRGVSLDEDSVSGLTLRAGRNVLVVKVAQGVGGWGVAARFELPNGSALRGR